MGASCTSVRAQVARQYGCKLHVSAGASCCTVSGPPAHPQELMRQDGADRPELNSQGCTLQDGHSTPKPNKGPGVQAAVESCSCHCHVTLVCRTCTCVTHVRVSVSSVTLVSHARASCPAAVVAGMPWWLMTPWRRAWSSSSSSGGGSGGRCSQVAARHRPQRLLHQHQYHHQHRRHHQQQGQPTFRRPRSPQLIQVPQQLHRRQHYRHNP